MAADNNLAGAMYPDQSLYPSNSGPELCRRINKTLQRADQIEQCDGGVRRDWFVPIVADAEAGFGGPLNCFEIMKGYIEAGAAGKFRFLFIGFLSGASCNQVTSLQESISRTNWRRRRNAAISAERSSFRQGPTKET